MLTKEQRLTFKRDCIDMWSWVARTVTAAGIGAAVYTANDLKTATQFFLVAMVAGCVSMGLIYWRNKI